MRTAEIVRKTNETDIKLTLNIDGSGKYDINTTCGFLKHMLELFARHGRFDITLSCIGDDYVDYHHTVEDIAIVLGKAFSEALAQKKGIVRYGDCTLPMDETLVLAAVDISGREYLGYALNIPTQKIGEFDTELVKEFMCAFSRNLKASVHVRSLAGENSHHIAEAAFKALARALAKAVEIDEKYKDEVPSTKGVL